MRVLLLGWVLCAAGCDQVLDLGSHDGGLCSPLTCSGCCGADGICRQGVLSTECGWGGAACLDCAASGLVCATGTCRALAGGDGGSPPDGGSQADGGPRPDGGADGGGTFDAGVRPDAGTYWDSPGPLFDGGAFSLAGAEAVVLINELSDGGAPPNATNLFRVTTQGQLLPVLNELEVYHAFPVQGGLYVQTHVGLTERHVLVRASDGLAYDLAGAPFLGLSCQLGIWELDNGDIALTNGQVYRRHSQSFSTLAAPGTCGGVTRWVSGNFVSAQVGTSAWKVFDVNRGTSSYIQFCNSGDVTALTDTLGLIDDCDSLGLMDFSTGTRSAIATNLRIGHHDSTGALFLSQVCPGAGSGFRLCHLTPTGVIETWLSTSMSLLSSVPWVSNEQYAVVRETGQTTLVRRGTDAKVPIAAGHDVSEMSLQASTLFFVATQANGRKTLGKVDLTSGATTVLATDLVASELRAMVP